MQTPYILVFTTYFHPHRGGLEKNTFELFNRLALAKKANIDVLCFNTNYVASEEQFGSLKIYRIDCWNILGKTYAIPKPWSLLHVWKKLYRNPYTHVSTQTRFFLTSFLGWIFAQQKKIPLIHTERGTSFAILKNKIAQLVAWFYDQTLGRIVISKANVVVGVSEAACNFARQLGAKNPQVIHNGIDLEKFITSQKIDRSWLDIDQEILVITFVGRLIQAKGLQDLLSALAGIKLPKWQLLIIGEGEYKKTLFKMISKLNLEKQVRFLGQRDEKEIIKILKITDIFINPSHTEGLPTTVIEAGAASCAVIASDVGGTREIIDDKKNGFLFPSRDVQALQKHLLYLAENKKLREEFGQKLFFTVQAKFNWPRIVDEYEKVLSRKT